MNNKNVQKQNKGKSKNICTFWWLQLLEGTKRGIVKIKKIYKTYKINLKFVF